MITRFFLRALMALNALLPLLRPAVLFISELMAVAAMSLGLTFLLFGHEIFASAIAVAVGGLLGIRIWAAQKPIEEAKFQREMDKAGERFAASQIIEDRRTGKAPYPWQTEDRYTTSDDASWEEFCKAAGIWFPRDRKGKKES
ncbi:hypothetical protein BH23GEM4_BH23GEM4_17460 [soil metagenome]